VTAAVAPTLASDGDHVVSPLRWWALGLSALAIFTSYYESDVIGSIADLLGRQRGFTQLQIGELNAVISLPNVVLALFIGLLIDRFGAARVTLWAAAIGFVGAVLTAIGEPYRLMWFGRFVFGVSEGAIFMSLIAGVAQWFPRSGVALATALFLSFARVGSFSLDMAPTWAHAAYESGWQAPLWLGAGLTGTGLVAAVVLRLLDARRSPATASAATQHAPIVWSEVWRFDLSYWYICGLHVLYAAVFFPFRQTYAIEYLQHAKGLTLAQAGQANAGVFFAAIFATPLFGLLADRIGHRALMLIVGTVLLPITLLILGATSLHPWWSTVLMGISWSLVPAVIWPSTALIVEPRRLGTALGIITLLQALGLWGSNRIAGWLADLAGAGAANPAGYNVMLWFFGVVSLLALTSVVLLWRREVGPEGHGLERADLSRTARRRQAGDPV
jgi:MFS family permease